jgi:hypothetical protein
LTKYLLPRETGVKKGIPWETMASKRKVYRSEKKKKERE